MKYVYYMRTEFLKGFQYRANYWATVLTSLIAVAIQWALWNAVYRGKTEIAGVGLTAMLTYSLMGRVASRFLTPSAIAQVGPRVRSGTIVHDMVKPVDLHVQLLFQNLGSALYGLLVIGGPVFLILKAFGCITTPPMERLPAFLVSLLAGHVTLFATAFASGVFTFFVKTGVGIEEIYTVIALLAGEFVPIDFFPAFLRSLSDYLPFKSIYYIPMAIWSGIVGPGEILSSLATQLVWLTVMVGISRLVWAKAHKALTIHGG